MSIDKLDLLLAEARTPDPSDNGFTEIVMQGIHADDRLWRHRRLLTRPVVIAAAAVLVTGGALAAAARINTLTIEHRASPAASTSRPPSGAQPRVTSGSVVVGQDSKPAGVPSSTRAAAPFKLHHYRNADYEWGYTSAHTAYVLDRHNGLRLVTELYTNAFATKRAHKITMTLTNTGARPLGITSQSGCALSAAAWPGRGSDGSASPSASRDPSSAKSWACSGGRDPRGLSGENFILSPGAAHTENVPLVLRGAGDWNVVGMCQCEVVAPPETTGATPLDGIQQLIVSGTLPAQTQQASGGLATPPLGVRVR